MPWDTLANRLRWLTDERKVIGRRELARRAGLKSGSHISVIISNDSGAKAETLAAIATAAGVDLNWLATGEGEPFATAHDPSPADHVSPPMPDYTATSAPVWANYPGWDRLVATALATDPALAPWAAAKLGTLHPVVLGPITPAVVADLIRFVMRHATPPADTPPRTPRGGG